MRSSIVLVVLAAACAREPGHRQQRAVTAEPLADPFCDGANPNSSYWTACVASECQTFRLALDELSNELAMNTFPNATDAEANAQLQAVMLAAYDDHVTRLGQCAGQEDSP